MKTGGPTPEPPIHARGNDTARRALRRV